MVCSVGTAAGTEHQFGHGSGYWPVQHMACRVALQDIPALDEGIWDGQHALALLRLHVRKWHPLIANQNCSEVPGDHLLIEDRTDLCCVRLSCCCRRDPSGYCSCRCPLHRPNTCQCLFGGPVLFLKASSDVVAAYLPRLPVEGIERFVHFCHVRH